MNAAIRKVVIALGAAYFVTAPTHGGDRIMLRCPKETLAEVCAAVEIEDEARRTEELYRTLAGALRSENEEVRGQAYRFVSDRISVSPLSNDAQVDPLLLEDALVAFDALETAQARRKHARVDPDDVDRIVRHNGQVLLDEAGLARAPKSDRLRIYERAIIDGEVLFGRVSRMPRDKAMVFAASEGLSELAAIVAVRCPDLSEAGQQYVRGCDYLAASFELGAGAEDPVDATTRAARRLAAMPVDELFARLRASAGWRRVVAETARSVCLVGSLEACQGLEPMFQGLGHLFWKPIATPLSTLAPTPLPDDATFRKEMEEDVYGSYAHVLGRLHREKAAAKRRNGT
jgi:hypothetical protein